MALKLVTTIRSFYTGMVVEFETLIYIQSFYKLIKLPRNRVQSEDDLTTWQKRLLIVYLHKL